MKHHPLIISFYKIGAIKFGDFTLKNGDKSKIYLDLRQLISYPDVLRSAAEAIWKKIHALHFDLLCGVPYTALPIATTISLVNHKPMIMRRKEKKNYGTKQQVDGAFKEGQNCIIVEDVVTTGSSIIETADDLESAGLKISDVVALIDRNQGGTDKLKKRNFKLHSVFSLEEVLHELHTSHFLTEKEAAVVDSIINENNQNESN